MNHLKARNLGMLCSILFLFAALGWSAPQAQQNDREFHWTGHLAADQLLEIKNVNGAIDATGESGDQIEVSAIKSGPDADEVKIEVVPSSQGVTICAIFPPGFFGGENRCEPGEGSHSSSNHSNNTRVDFTVRVPKNIRLNAFNVNGNVHADGLGRYVDARTVNGSVHVSTESWATAKTVNGSITARLGRGDWPGTLQFSTVNGGVDLELPSNLNADVNCTTVNGSMRTDFPVTIQGSFGRRYIHGTIGSGGRDLDVKTVNGTIELRKSTI